MLFGIHDLVRVMEPLSGLTTERDFTRNGLAMSHHSQSIPESGLNVPNESIPDDKSRESSEVQRLVLRHNDPLELFRPDLDAIDF